MASPVTVVVNSFSPIHQAGLEALLASWPGLRVIAPEGAGAAPQVTLWEPAPGEEALSAPAGTAVLMLVAALPPGGLPPGVAGLLTLLMTSVAALLPVRRLNRIDPMLAFNA